MFLETDGLWSNWGEFDACSSSCVGKQRRIRRCDNPPPKGRGRTCPGEGIDERLCNHEIKDLCKGIKDIL